MAKTDNVTGVVAHGRTVEVDGQMYGPGKTVELPADEVQMLRRRGFLIDEEADDDESAAATPKVTITTDGDKVGKPKLSKDA